MSSKTPYEIRSELLQLATTICFERHRAAAHAKEFENYQKSGNIVEIGPTTAPTVEEIIEEAEKLNNFVSLGGGSKK